MFQSLLKYDFKAIFRYWWIAAITTMIASFSAGILIRLVFSPLPESIQTILTILLFLLLLLIPLLPLASSILIYVRFYRNFYSDQGYLTFTLPVTPFSLLNSKLLVGVLFSVADVFVILTDCLLLCSFLDGFWTEVLPEILDLIEDFFEISGWNLVYVLEAAALCLLGVVLNNLLVYLCITVGALLTKKHKALLGFGIYYGVSGLVSFAAQIFVLFCVPGITAWFMRVSSLHIDVVVALILFMLLLFFAIFALLEYLLLYWMTDRKLNLS